MAQYSDLTQTELLSILSNYSISSNINFEILSGGWENTNYKVDSGTHSYVLSICEQKTTERAKNLALLLLHLKNEGFETSRVLLNKQGSPISIWNDKPVLLKYYIKGEVLNTLTPDLLVLAGSQLGKLHKIKAPEYLPSNLDFGIEQFYKVQLYAKCSPFEKWLNKIANYVTPYLEKDLPKTLIHSDVFCDNIIIKDERQKVVIMDFEEAAHYFRTFDLGMMIIGTCSEEGTINLEKVAHLLKGYSFQVKLHQSEMRALKAMTVYAGASMTFWRHINFNYTRPDPELSEHYLGLKVLTDYVYDLDDKCFEILLE